MSLLMQALKKAERAKQNALPEEELDKPSQAFDEVLALTPEPAPARPVSAAELTLEPMDGFSLEPVAPPVAAATTGLRPSPSPLPAASDHKAPGQTMDLALDPVATPPALPAPAASASSLTTSGAAATAAPAMPAANAGLASAGAGQAGLATTATTAAIAGTAAAASLASGAHAATIAATSAARSAGAGPAAAAGSTVGARSGAAGGAAGAGADHGSSASGSSAAGNGKGAGASAGTGAAARARARTAATAEPSGLDPERLRLIGLIALLVLVVGGFGMYYWRALTAPGAGAGLPPVPMPPPGATGATPGPGMIIAAGPTTPADAGAGNSAAPDETDPMLAPASASSSRAQQELERRLAKTEQDLAATQQSIQAVAAANAPRAEQMPVLAAPDNNDIRVSRSQQIAPVAPALDAAYLAFNGGDLGTAQQQYEAALSQDANNRDALLGAAHVAARQNQKDKAASYYLRLLELSPNDADATAGLIGLRQGDIGQSEARLKAILSNNPEAGPVLFALGNLYAQQGRWADAQQAYFRAVGAAPDNPDYIYNLAIGLDRLNQTRLAFSHYQRALALAQDKAVGFDRGALRKRMHELGGAPTH